MALRTYVIFLPCAQEAGYTDHGHLSISPYPLIWGSFWATKPQILHLSLSLGPIRHTLIPFWNSSYLHWGGKKKKRTTWHSFPNGRISCSSVPLFFDFSPLSGFISLVDYKNNEEKLKLKSPINLTFPSSIRPERTALYGSKIGTIHSCKSIWNLLSAEMLLC